MDADIEGMSRDQRVSEVRRLRQGIRAHRDSTGQDLCWLIRRCGRYCRNHRTRFRPFPIGRSSFVAAISTTDVYFMGYG